MNRRGFLKGLVAGAALLAMPKTVAENAEEVAAESTQVDVPEDWELIADLELEYQKESQRFWSMQPRSRSEWVTYWDVPGITGPGDWNYNYTQRFNARPMKIVNFSTNPDDYPLNKPAWRENQMSMFKQWVDALDNRKTPTITDWLPRPWNSTTIEIGQSYVPFHVDKRRGIGQMDVYKMDDLLRAHKQNLRDDPQKGGW